MANNSILYFDAYMEKKGREGWWNLILKILVQWKDNIFTPFCFCEVCVYTSLTNSRAVMLDFECVHLHGDRLTPRNTVERSACSADL